MATARDQYKSSSSSMDENYENPYYIEPEKKSKFRQMTNDIKTSIRDSMKSIQNQISNNFSKQLNWLTLIVTFITLITVVIIIFCSSGNENAFYYTLVQYITISIFFVILFSYFFLNIFWSNGKLKDSYK